jgi:putative membrane protein insertion efficiency factor
MTSESRVTERDSRLLAKGLIRLVHFYQVLLSSRSMLVCPFEPSCSEYMVLSIQKYGSLQGCLKGLKRICRCNPFYEGCRIDWP